MPFDSVGHFKHFTGKLPREGHVLLPLTYPGDLDYFLKTGLFDPYQRLSAHQLWGKGARQTVSLGGKTGWVPNHLPVVFFSSTVLEEAALSLAGNSGLLRPENRHIQEAFKLIRQAGLENLSERSPWTLSTGESKLLWVVIQWCKSPQWLFIDDLPANFSEETLNKVIAMMLAPVLGGPRQIVLGFVDNSPWIEPLSRAGWHTADIFTPVNHEK